MGYYEMFAKVAKADAKRAEQERQQRAIEADARKARRMAIQPQMDALGAELDAVALRGGSLAEINAVGAKIDALLSSIN